MPAPTPVEALHAEYAPLLFQQPSLLTDDQRRSLEFYAGDLVAVARFRHEDDPEGDVAVWIRKTLALEVFVRRVGRMPRENRRLPAGAISAEENVLVAHVRSQRRLFAVGRLCSYQQGRLQCIGGFSFHPLDDLWRANVEAYGTFTNDRRRAPRLRSDNALESGLARWAAKVRWRYWAGSLPQQRINDLTNSLDFWTWGTPPGR